MSKKYQTELPLGIPGAANVDGRFQPFIRMKGVEVRYGEKTFLTAAQAIGEAQRGIELITRGS